MYWNLLSFVLNVASSGIYFALFKRDANKLMLAPSFLHLTAGLCFLISFIGQYI